MKYIAEVDVETKKEVCVTFEYYDAKGNHCLIRKLAHPLKEALENYSKMQKQQPCEEWIPVSEKLPEEIGTYMTTVDYGMYGLAAGQRYYHGKGLGWEDDCVIAWMPLPEPYKTESEDKNGNINNKE